MGDQRPPLSYQQPRVRGPRPSGISVTALVLSVIPAALLVLNLVAQRLGVPRPAEHWTFFVYLPSVWVSGVVAAMLASAGEGRSRTLSMTAMLLLLLAFLTVVIAPLSLR
jgi:hypothetical protein